MNRIPIHILTFFIILLFSCSKDNEEDLMNNSKCDTISVEFNRDILPILDTRCYTCHDIGNTLGNGIELEPYSSLKPYVDNGKISCVINHNAGCSAMPKNSAKLPSCEINKIEKWISDGAVEN